MKLLPICVILLISTATTFAQNSRYNPFAQKPGSCPPALPVNICESSCYSDSYCVGNEKCCPTECGGSICSKPVTMSTSKEKPGICPRVPRGRWVCSSTCTYDSDCRANFKCCANRCGALACMKPEDFEIFESVEIPVAPVEEDSRRSREDYYNRLRYINSNPYYAYNNN